MPDEMPKKYIPADQEPKIRARWDAADAFHADPERVLEGKAEPYTILIPPPNVTAALHLGHALNNTIQDILIRAHRMMGFETLWMPGTDHAGIATQTVVDKRLKAEGKPALADYKKQEAAGEPGREKFIEQVQAWKDEYEERITDQLKAMGCSCDWARQRFTMDDVCAKAVREAFFRLFKDGLIYRGKRLVNWDPVTQTALADDEVEMEEVEGIFAYLRYPLVHPAEKGDHSPVTWGELASRGYPGAEEHPEDDPAYITVATTRPETYLGDVAVAINPEDPRAKALKWLMCELPLVGRTIPIIEDDYVVLPDPESSDSKARMATGFLKVTPAHDPNDYEIGQRHADDITDRCSAGEVVINVMAPDATISADFGWNDYDSHTGAEVFVGLSREEARKKVLEEFKARTVGNDCLLDRVVPHAHSVGHSYRSHAAIEPYMSDQWYVRVTDDRLRGAAQRALNPAQRTDASLHAWPQSAPSSPSAPSGTGFQPVSTPAPSGSSRPITRDLTIQERHLPHWQAGGSTYFVTFRLSSGELADHERDTVLDACLHFDGTRAIIRLVTVMPDHVHLILTPLEKTTGQWWSLGELIHSIKSYSANQINESRGATGTLWQDEHFDRLIRNEGEYRETWGYVIQNPVEAGLTRDPGEYGWTRVGRAQQQHGSVGSDGLEARPTRAGSTDHGDGSLTIHPPRYAKTYESWHDSLRDWCISRQLWWGHRIPVWSRTYNDTEMMLGAADAYKTSGYATQRDHLTNTLHVCPPTDEHNLEADGFVRDPDVLDTWFSSATWPLSTLGWPSNEGDTAGLLDAFNPTSVLTTAREIITLWVSRMVMFNRYFLGHGGTEARRHEGAGQVPFNDVFIHAMIQDGEGRKMSKSLGNGVDPLDIIHSHGSDAMRFTLCQMTTNTQDVRMPVEKDETTGRNTSPKFDIGRNFATKLWNASRFVLGMLDTDDTTAGELTLVDRWMLSRLSQAIEASEAALKNYSFSVYAERMYDLLWREYCDWYLEAVKPTVATNAAQRACLRNTLDAILRLLHPIMPFVTESIHEQLAARPAPATSGLTIEPSRRGDVLCTAGWPVADGLKDAQAETEFARVQELVTAIREVRAQHQVAPKRWITLHATGKTLELVRAAAGLVEVLAGVETVTDAEPEGTAVVFRFEDDEPRVSDLADAVDAGAERERLERQLTDAEKSVKALEGRLNNPGYVNKAPEHLVNQTRDELAKAQADRDSVKAALEALA